MNSASAIDIGRPAIRRETRWRYWRGELKGSEYAWALAFIVPYIAVFFVFVAYTYCIPSHDSARVLAYQELPTSIQCGEAMARRRK